MPMSVKPQGLDFLRRVERFSNEVVARCFQCDKCATGCPLVAQMDHSPNHLFRLVQLGARDEVLNSNAPWFCLGCFTCSVRCPNDIDIAHVMDALRQLAVRAHVKPALPQARLFHRLFLEQVRLRGRVSELALMARYQLQAGHPWRHLALARAMWRRGRLRLELHSPRVRRRDEILRLFERAARENEGEGAD